MAKAWVRPSAAMDTWNEGLTEPDTSKLRWQHKLCAEAASGGIADVRTGSTSISGGATHTTGTVINKYQRCDGNWGWADVKQKSGDEGKFAPWTELCKFSCFSGGVSAADQCIMPTYEPTQAPTATPTETPTQEPTFEPTQTDQPTAPPTNSPTEVPTAPPTHQPTSQPTSAPTRSTPTFVVTFDNISHYENGWEKLEQALKSIGVSEEEYSDLVDTGDILFKDKAGFHDYTFSNSRTVVQWPADVAIWVDTTNLTEVEPPVVPSSCWATAAPVAVALLALSVHYNLIA